jgi:hypothetical protein
MSLANRTLEKSKLGSSIAAKLGKLLGSQLAMPDSSECVLSVLAMMVTADDALKGSLPSVNSIACR